MATGDEVGKGRRREEKRRIAPKTSWREKERRGRKGERPIAVDGTYRKRGRARAGKAKKARREGRRGKGTPFSRERRERRYFFVLSPHPSIPRTHRGDIWLLFFCWLASHAEYSGGRMALMAAAVAGTAAAAVHNAGPTAISTPLLSLLLRTI